MVNILELIRGQTGYTSQTLIGGALILAHCMVGSTGAIANEATALLNQADACDGVSFWQLPNGQCLNLDNLSFLGVAQGKHAVIQTICQTARETAQPNITTKPVNMDGSGSRDATLMVFPESWEEKHHFAIQVCSQVKETEINLAQVESIVSGWFKSVSDQVGQAYRHPR